MGSSRKNLATIWIWVIGLMFCFSLCSFEIYGSPQKEAKTIKCSGTIVYTNSISQLPINEGNQFDWIDAIYKLGTFLFGMSALICTIFDRVKKHKLQNKYEKNRTPVI